MIQIAKRSLSSGCTKLYHENGCEGEPRRTRLQERTGRYQNVAKRKQGPNGQRSSHCSERPIRATDSLHVHISLLHPPPTDPSFYPLAEKTARFALEVNWLRTMSDALFILTNRRYRAKAGSCWERQNMYVFRNYPDPESISRSFVSSCIVPGFLATTKPSHVPVNCRVGPSHQPYSTN